MFILCAVLRKAAAPSFASVGVDGRAEDPYGHFIAQMLESLPFQEDAYRKLAPVVAATRVKTPTDRAPKVLCLLGNSSTGKTQTAQLLFHFFNCSSDTLPANILWDPDSSNSAPASNLLTINVNSLKNTTAQVPQMIFKFFTEDVMSDDRVAVILFDEADKGMEKFWIPLMDVFNKGCIEVKSKEPGETHVAYCRTKLVIICCFNVRQGSILNQPSHIPRPDDKELDKRLRKELKFILKGNDALYTRISDVLCPFWSYDSEQERAIVQRCLERVIRLHATPAKGRPRRTLVFEPACIPFFHGKLHVYQSVRGMKRSLTTLLDDALHRLGEAGAGWSRIEICVGPSGANYLLARQFAEPAAAAPSFQVSRSEATAPHSSSSLPQVASAVALPDASQSAVV